MGGVGERPTPRGSRWTRFRPRVRRRIFTVMSSQNPSSGVEARLRERFPTDRFPEVVSLYLFGSVAIDATHHDSDVDVGVLVDRGIAPSKADRSELRVRLGSELIALTRRNEVDVVVLNDAPPLFARAIVTGGKRLLCRDDEIDRRFVLDTLLRAADLEPWLRRMQQTKAEALQK